MKRYELKFIDGGLGVFKVSVVKDPAIEANLVHFKAEKEETQFFADEEKRVIYSVVMRPNIDIFRRNVNGEPANVFYTPETVEQQQINYFRNNGNSETNINHSSLANAEGIFPFESWIVDDAETDRAVKFGLDVIKGDWVMGHKVDNDELWTEHIKTGKIDGLSIEATNINYELKEDITMNKDDKKAKSKSLVERLKTFLFEEEIAEVSKWWNTVTNTTFEIGEVVTRQNKNMEGEADGDPIPVNAGEYELKDGRRILTDAEGIIRHIFPVAEGTEAPAEAPADDAEEMAAHPDETPAEKKAREKKEKEEKEAKEAKAKKDKAAADKMAAHPDGDDEDEEAKKKAADAAAEAADADGTSSHEDNEDEEDEDEETLESLNAEIVDLKAQIATLKADAVKAATDLETMAAQTPAAAAIKNLPQIESLEMTKENYEKMSNREKMLFNKENKSY